ncbi:hypothetical protein BJ742DRAFT_708910 [Cladochytrium replicatum]|nr:hypothetical protein BJ742DRAFT_708910 [Cladochytrium replicatum]
MDPSLRQPKPYLLVLDFEATCDDLQRIQNQEIIELPIVVIDTTSRAIVAQFHEYVRPIANPKLSKFCTELTGIDQQTVDAADTFPGVYQRMLKFLDTNGLRPPHNSLFVTCGDWDLKTMIVTQMKYSGIEVPDCFSQWSNLKFAMKEAMPGALPNKLGMPDMLKAVGLPLVGRHHSGIDDSRNIASIVLHLLHAGKGFVFDKPTGIQNAGARSRDLPRDANSSKERKSASSVLPALSSPSTNVTRSALSPQQGKPNMKGSSKFEPFVPAELIPVKSMFVDIGTNLTHKSFTSAEHGGVEGVLERARKANVGILIITGTSVKESEHAIELCRRYNGQREAKGYPRLYSTVGVHPHDADRHINLPDIDKKLKKLILDNSDVVCAVGECGLDFDRNFSTPENQERMFSVQLKIAAEVRLPLFLHERSAKDKFTQLVTPYIEKGVSGVVHCATDVSAIPSYLSMGFYVGITGWVCDERRGVDLADLVKTLPKHQLMIETDAPFLAPRNAPFKIRNNEPQWLGFVAAKVAEMRGETVEEVAGWSTTNAEELFKITK